MTDVLERLRAANPVSDCAQPDLQSVLLRLSDTSPAVSGIGAGAGSRWRMVRRARVLRVAVIVSALGASLAVFAMLSRGGTGISLLQRAYAATDPAGGIVHYVTSTRSTIGSGKRFSSIESHAQVWRSGSRSRRIEVTVTRLRDGQPQQGGSYEEVHERTATGETSTSYSSRTNTVFKGFRAFRGETSPGSINCTSSPACSFTIEDPVLALRELYATRRVHQAGHAQLDGKTLTVLEVKVPRQSPEPLRITSQRILLDPKTGVPVELVTRYGDQPGALRTTTIFHQYQHLRLTPQTERLLRVRAHPDARLECVPALHCTGR